MTSEQSLRRDTSPELNKCLDIIATRQERPVLFIVGELNNRVANELSIYMSIRSWGEFIKHNGVSVLIHSHGGDPKEAYRMMLILRLYVNDSDIEVLVPREAKSAATLFCLGANKVLMGGMGELGPLDMQLVWNDEHGRKHRRSTLDSFKASEQMLDHTKLAYQKIIGNTPISASQANPQGSPLEEHNANGLIASIVSNLYQKFDPDELGRDSRYLSVGEEYASRLLQRAKYEKGKIDAIARKLVWDYPSHDFLIDWREAEEMGLNVEYLDDTTSLFYGLTLNQICEDNAFDDYYHLLEKEEVFTFVGLGIPQEKDEQVDATDGSDDRGDDDGTDDDATTE